MNKIPFPGLKLPTTYHEQVSLLKNRGLIIADEEYAARVLQNINYYRFSAYLLPFRVLGSERYVPGTTFDRVIPLQALIAEYEESLDISCIWFPANWSELLSQAQCVNAGVFLTP